MLELKEWMHFSNYFVTNKLFQLSCSLEKYVNAYKKEYEKTVFKSNSGAKYCTRKRGDGC